ncbi:hypothetical protein [Vannielia sp. SX4]|uniref:hypothetical protein n=1 Tax=Vannielia sp. SX4 TaxID=3463852 RepID=UPI00405A3933
MSEVASTWLKNVAGSLTLFMFATPCSLYAQASSGFEYEVRGIGAAPCGKVMDDPAASRDLVISGYVWGAMATAAMYEHAIDEKNGFRQEHVTEVASEVRRKCTEGRLRMFHEVVAEALYDMGASVGTNRSFQKP